MATVNYRTFASRPHYQQQLDALARIINRECDCDLPTVSVDDTTPEAIIVASRVDARAAWHQHGLPIILLEHGAGQTYLLPDGTRVDGGGDTKPDPNIIAHLVPNRHAHQHTTHLYPNAAGHTVGSPWLHHLQTIRRQPEPGLTVYMPHWNPPLTTAARGSWPWAAPILRHLHDQGIRLAVSPHPRHNLNLTIHKATRNLNIPTISHQHAIQQATAIITDNTSMGWETMALGIPTIWLQTPAADTHWKTGHGLRYPGPGYISIPLNRTQHETLHTITHTRPGWGQQWIRNTLYPTQNNIHQQLHHTLTHPKQPQPEDTT